MKSIIVFFFSIVFILPSAYGQLEAPPPNPKPGKCYVRCITPEVYETSEKRILTRPAYKSFVRIPAEYRTVDERILIRPASKKYIYIPAEYKTITEEIRVVDSFHEIKIIPPQFRTTVDTLETKPKTGRWEYRQAIEDCKSNDPRDCMVLCFVEYPAEFKNVSIQTVENGPVYVKTPKAGQTLAISKQEIFKEARMEEVAIPPEYMTITKMVLVKDEEVREVEVPAEYTIETFDILKDKGGRVVWEEIECALTEYNVLPILYETGNSRLSPASRQIIDERVLKLLQDMPNIRVEITSHTDTRGDAGNNLKLSQSRADEVVNYLVAKGIQRNRLTAIGFGENYPKNHCKDGVECTEEEHRQNRRTEFRVLSN